VSNALIRGGVPSAAALTFLLAAPAINPVVLVSTAVAFAGHPMMVIARFLASVFTAWVVGWLWVGFGRDVWIRRSGKRARPDEPRWETFRRTALHDFLHAGGFLVFGAADAATINVALPPHLLTRLSSVPALAIVALGLLAVIVAICSEADAFVAASFTSFSPSAQLVFMTVSPMVDVKLISMQAGTFGASFAARFAPATFAVAVLVGTLVGRVAL
jgi:uncharacterized membrane protein YraQ (UPF0718 family)